VVAGVIAKSLEFIQNVNTLGLSLIDTRYYIDQHRPIEPDEPVVVAMISLITSTLDSNIKLVDEYKQTLHNFEELMAADKRLKFDTLKGSIFSSSYLYCEDSMSNFVEEVKYIDQLTYEIYDQLSDSIDLGMFHLDCQSVR
jgi:hypothetical protein